MLDFVFLFQYVAVLLCQRLYREIDLLWCKLEFHKLKGFSVGLLSLIVLYLETAGESVWKVFFFTPKFTPEDSSGCYDSHVCFCYGGFITRHDPPLLFDLSRDPEEKVPLTPETESRFYEILSVIQLAVDNHTRSLQIVSDQLSWNNLVWKPWLQLCCSSFFQFCYCDYDSENSLPEVHSG